MAKQIRRRSIVEFEQWVAGEIQSAECDLATLRDREETLVRERDAALTRLATLRRVAERLTVWPESEEEDAEAEAPRALQAV